MRKPKTTTIIATLACLALVSCQKDEYAPNERSYQIHVGDMPADLNIDRVEAHIYPIGNYAMANEAPDADETSNSVVIARAYVKDGAFTITLKNNFPLDLLGPIWNKEDEERGIAKDMSVSDKAARCAGIRIWGYHGDKKRGYFAFSTEQEIGTGALLHIFTNKKVSVKGYLPIPPSLGYEFIKFNLDFQKGFGCYDRHWEYYYHEEWGVVSIGRLWYTTSVGSPVDWSFVEY